VIVATSQLGYRPQSPKTVTLLLKGEGDLPEEIPFFVQRFGDRRARVQAGKPREWTDELFRWPFDSSPFGVTPYGVYVEPPRTDLQSFRPAGRRRHVRTLSPRGRVTEVRLLRGIPLLDDAAIEAVRQWVYTPTLLNEVPVPVIMTVTVNFSLSGRD
jgi:TonB family protein